MATTEDRLIELTLAIALDIKTIRHSVGKLNLLNTTDKTNIVLAINELIATQGSGGGGGSGAGINDQAGEGNFSSTWSADKIIHSINEAALTLKNSLIDGASGAFDTLRELQLILEDNTSFANSIVNSLTTRVRFDSAQVLNSFQKTQVLSNIGAVSSSAIGNTELDLLALYEASKA